MKLFLITDELDKFIALCSREEDAKDIMDWGDDIKEINFE